MLGTLLQDEGVRAFLTGFPPGDWEKVILLLVQQGISSLGDNVGTVAALESTVHPVKHMSDVVTEVIAKKKPAPVVVEAPKKTKKIEKKKKKPVKIKKKKHVPPIYNKPSSDWRLHGDAAPAAEEDAEDSEDDDFQYYPSWWPKKGGFQEEELPKPDVKEQSTSTTTTTTTIGTDMNDEVHGHLSMRQRLQAALDRTAPKEISPKTNIATTNTFSTQAGDVSSKTEQDLVVDFAKENLLRALLAQAQVGGDGKVVLQQTAAAAAFKDAGVSTDSDAKQKSLKSTVGTKRYKNGLDAQKKKAFPKRDNPRLSYSVVGKNKNTKVKVTTKTAWAAAVQSDGKTTALNGSHKHKVFSGRASLMEQLREDKRRYRERLKRIAEQREDEKSRQARGTVDNSVALASAEAALKSDSAAKPSTNTALLDALIGDESMMSAFGPASLSGGFGGHDPVRFEATYQKQQAQLAEAKANKRVSNTGQQQPKKVKKAVAYDVDFSNLDTNGIPGFGDEQVLVEPEKANASKSETKKNAKSTGEHKYTGWVGEYGPEHTWTVEPSARSSAVNNFSVEEEDEAPVHYAWKEAAGSGYDLKNMPTDPLEESFGKEEKEQVTEEDLHFEVPSDPDLTSVSEI